MIHRAALEEEVEEEEEEAAEDSAAGEEEVPVVIVEDEAEAADADADQGAAFDPATGEINWDCPCLGGMAHGPCGEHFKDAFSCFVRSEQEPKGIECVDKFKAMQDCFRAHPEVYKEELEMDEQVSEGDVCGDILRSSSINDSHCLFDAQDELDALVDDAEMALGIEKRVQEEAALGAQQTVSS